MLCFIEAITVRIFLNCTRFYFLTAVAVPKPGLMSCIVVWNCRYIPTFRGRRRTASSFMVEDGNLKSRK